MAKNDRDLFERLRKAGVRKPVAKTLSGIGEGASQKAVRAAHIAAGELRSLADEIERRLPGARGSRRATANQGARNQTRAGGTNRTASPRAASPRAASPRATTPRANATATARTSGARAPRGQNKAKILASLKSGPKTGPEIAKETGISTRTVSSTLSKMAASGEVLKAERGYRLPQ